jgi:hypothetical protein
MKKFLTLAKDTDTLAQALQQAVEIEMATIPIYLYTYYSIIRNPNQDQIQADYTNAFIDNGMSPGVAAQAALEKSAAVMVFANKAGATIMSVVIEEMLHMSLASNLHRALVGMPDLVGISPTVWPTNTSLRSLFSLVICIACKYNGFAVVDNRNNPFFEALNLTYQ